VKDTAETKPKICHSDNPTGQNPDLKAKITSKIESKNVFAFLKLFRFRDMRKRFPGSEVSMDFNSGAQTCHKMTRLTSLVQFFLQTDIYKKCPNPFRKPPKIAVQSALAHMIASGV